jgi:hypothetical protein
MYQAKVTEIMKLTNEPGTKGPWAQSRIIIDVDNVSENVFSIRKDSNFSKMVFLRNVEEWRAFNIGGISRCGFVVNRNLFFISRSSSRIFGVQISVGSRKTRSLGRHDESSGQCDVEEEEVWSGECLYGREVSNFRETLGLDPRYVSIVPPFDRQTYIMYLGLVRASECHADALRRSVLPR